jgi:triacylglycerol lipase
VPDVPSAPIVLAHGLCGFDRLFNCRRPTGPEYFPGVRRHLEAAGARVLVARVSPTAGIATRAAELRDVIRRAVGAGPVHVVGHSLGGLDARHMIARLGMAAQVISLTTVGTPHRGSPFADWALARFARVFLPLVRRAGLPDAAFHDLTTPACAEFNRATPDAPGVRYFSVAGVVEQPWLGAEWAVPSRIVGRAEGPNDGVVSVASAGWGEWTAVWPGDHLNLVNWPNRKMQKANAWPDRAADYLGLLPFLAAAESA